MSKELKDNDANPLIGLEIKAQTDASIVGLKGKLTITGGSDKSGVPMRSDVHGGARKYVLMSRGVGLPKAGTGERERKLVRGNSISEEIYQINCKFDGELPKDDVKSEKDDVPTEEKPKEKKA